jgi:hypothetical protein
MIKIMLEIGSIALLIFVLGVIYNTYWRKISFMKVGGVEIRWKNTPLYLVVSAEAADVYISSIITAVRHINGIIGEIVFKNPVIVNYGDVTLAGDVSITLDYIDTPDTSHYYNEETGIISRVGIILPHIILADYLQYKMICNELYSCLGLKRSISYDQGDELSPAEIKLLQKTYGG